MLVVVIVRDRRVVDVFVVVVVVRDIVVVMWRKERVEFK